MNKITKSQHSKNANRLSVGSRTSIGLIRDHNEDSLLVKPPLYVIADGMGGHAAGEIASELAVRTLENAQIDTLDPDSLRRTVAMANDAIIKGALDGLGRSGMGTTLTAAVIENDQILIAQVGDSRAYILSNGSLRQATRDHSLVEELMAAGQITEDEARNHPNRSVITRALGSDATVLPDLYEMRLHAGDRLLLCSDGLNSMLDSRTIERVLKDNPDPQQAADALVDAANDAGGFDNITTIVVNINEVNAQKKARQKRRFLRGIIVFSLVFVLLVGGAIGSIYAYARNSAFLIDEGGRVALYQGLPGDVMGIELKWHIKTTDISVSNLNPTTADELKDGLKMESMEQAEELIAQYEEQHKKK